MQKKTLVLGTVIKSNEYASLAIKMLIDNGHKVVAVGRVADRVEGVKIVTETPHFEAIDTVTLYLHPMSQVNYYNYIISLKPKRVIFNPGTENSEFQALLKENNIDVEVACTLVLLSTNQY